MARTVPLEPTDVEPPEEMVREARRGLGHAERAFREALTYHLSGSQRSLTRALDEGFAWLRYAEGRCSSALLELTAGEEE